MLFIEVRNIVLDVDMTREDAFNDVFHSLKRSLWSLKSRIRYIYLTDTYAADSVQVNECYFLSNVFKNTTKDCWIFNFVLSVFLANLF